MTTKELKQLVEQALKAAQATQAAQAGVDHPQVREMYLTKCGEVAALEAVLDAMSGNRVILRAMGERI